MFIHGWAGRRLALAALIFTGTCAVGRSAPRILETFEGDTLPATLAPNNNRVAIVPHEGGRALRVEFNKAEWPGVFFRPLEGTWDWSGYVGIAVDLFNPESEPVTARMRVDNAGADGVNFCNNGQMVVLPGQSATLQVRFHTGTPGAFWGMRGIPVYGPIRQGAVLDPAHITACQVLLPRPDKPRTLILDNLRLFGTGDALDAYVPLPFVDRFGQYKHDEWPGKVHDEAQLAARREQEERVAAAAPVLPHRDPYGGWAEGPRLAATGWFRTERLGGAWWLVTPEGRLFFSLGVDCVRTREETFVERRKDWFEWLPDPQTDTPFNALYGYRRGAHSMAEAINGAGRTFSFYRANLLRKYGENGTESWRNTTYRRLQHWGFNTIGNWSERDVLAHSPIPFVATGGVRGGRLIEGGTGYWSKMKDVFDPGFAEAVEQGARSAAEPYAANPLCIGYYMDNELAWSGIARGALASPPDQPCRRALVEELRAKYGTLDALNRAWDAQARDWDGLRLPATLTDKARADADAFEYRFARVYFDTIKAALRRHAPNQLYLGCRFAGPPQDSVMRACADVVDVMSFNLYERAIEGARWTGERDRGKPIIIGEFHFGALDRGMFHQGLVPVANQEERAESYMRYVRSVADCPAFVGCHWFQYVDEPITGRSFDGENYNIGFVDVTDTPYPELVAAARQVHAEVYARRYERTGKQTK